MQAAAVVVDHQIGVEIQLGAEPVAGRAGAERVVERKEPRLDLGDREARHRAGKFRREDRLLARIGVLGQCDAVGQAERRLERIGEAAGDVVAHHHAVDHDLDVVREILLQPLAFV